MTAVEIPSLIDKLRRIPDGIRVFDRDLDWAWRNMRLRRELLVLLAERGLPSTGTGSALRFDWYDLFNCAMQLDQGPVSRAVRRFWPAALRRAAQGHRARYELSFQMRCPAPGHDAPCRFVVALPGGERREHTVTTGGGRATGPRVEVSPRIDWPGLPSEARAVLDAAADLEYLMLGRTLKRDLEFIRSSRLADCTGVAELLAQEAERRGVPVRRSFGYVVVPPFAARHSWVELRGGDTWVPVDPLLIRTMIRWGALDPADWDPYRSIGPILARVDDHEVPVIQHNGARTHYTLPTRLLDGPA